MMKDILRKEVYKAYLKVRYPRLFISLNQLNNSQWLSTDTIKAFQWEKLKRIIDYAYKNVPYYRRVFNESAITPKDIQSFEDLIKIPYLTKEDIISNPQELLSIKYKKKYMEPNSTGGSTGLNMSFFTDVKSKQFVSATLFRNDSWAGLKIGDKCARIWGSQFDLAAQKKLKDGLFNRLSGNLFLSSYDLSDTSMEDYASKMMKHQPKVIIGYPSPLCVFSQFLINNNITDIQPHSVITSAETLYNFQRETIEHAFGCKVFNRYGCREFAAVAHECSEHWGMHINSEHVYVECVDEFDRPLMNEIGDFVITDLDNYAMPFIRYKVGDAGSISNEPCNCGRSLPLISKIEGRTFDVITGTNGKRLGGTFWTLLLRTAVTGVKQFQIVQDAKEHISVKIVPNNTFDKSMENVLIQKIKEFCGNEMTVVVDLVSEIPVPPSGKSRFVISKINVGK